MSLRCSSPGPEFVHDGFAEFLPSRTPHFGGIAGEGGIALDLEQRGDEVQAVACDGVAESRGFDEAAARVGHATRALATGALDAPGARARPSVQRLGGRETHAMRHRRSV